MKCYRCDRIANSREHIPPICLFPEQKDTNGIDFRKNLITVPSCEIHNSKKSTDDEFLMMALSGILGNNEVGFLHFQTKVNRALRRKRKSFLNDVVILNYKEENIRHKNVEFSFLIGRSDNDRLWECFTNIAYGLYYNEFEQYFEGEISMIFDFLKYEDQKISDIINLIEKLYNNDDLKKGVTGENPEVFTYQFSNPDEDGLIALKLTFYKGTKIYISFKPKGSKMPFDLGMYMALKGFETRFKVGDEEIIINKQ